MATTLLVCDLGINELNASKPGVFERHLDPLCQFVLFLNKVKKSVKFIHPVVLNVVKRVSSPYFKLQCLRVR